MSIALIDHSTLSSVQRILGQIEVRDKSVIDGDICAFENFISAILFYNEWIAIDDYIDEFSESRKKEFHYLSFLDPKEFNGDQILEKSLEKADFYYPTISGGEFTDEAFREFFRILSINIKCTWDISNSIYYLTLKMLGEKGGYEFKKYSEVCHQIFSELGEIKNSGASRNQACKLFDQMGEEISNTGYRIPNAKWGNGETGGLTTGLSGFISALNWISYKSIYYTSFAEYLKADSFLHPIRQNFQLYYLEKTKFYSLNYIQEVLNRFSKQISEEISILINQARSSLITVSVPNFLTYIISATKDPSSIIAYAFDLRDRKEFVEAREQFGVLRNLFDEEDYSTASRKKEKIERELHSTFNEIRRTYGLPILQGDGISKIVTNLNSAGSVFSLPSIPNNLESSRFLNVVSQMRNRKSWSVIYRNLSKELLNIQSLGQYHDLIVKNVKVNENLRAHNPRVESEKYQFFHSQWKSPM